MLNDKALAFLATHHEAVMVTLKANGTPQVARVWVGVVDGRLQSSGTQARLRTRQLRRDPRSTLCVFAPNGWQWIGIEGRVTILDGPEAIPMNLALRRVMDGEPADLDAYLQRMADEDRIIYQWTVDRVYGQLDLESWPASYGSAEADRQRRLSS